MVIILDCKTNQIVGRIVGKDNLTLWEAIDLIGVWNNPENTDGVLWEENCEINGKKYYCDELEIILENGGKYEN